MQRTEMDPDAAAVRRQGVRDDERESRFRAQRREQDGVFHVDQAREAGHSRAAISRRVQRGDWLRVGPGVLRTADHPETSRARVRAAVLSIGDRATLVGRSAAFWWRMTDLAPAEIEIAVPHACRPRPRPGVRILRRAVPPGERVVVDRVSVTKKAPTALAAATASGLLPGAKLLDRALQSGVTLDQLRRIHRREAGREGALLAWQLILLAAGGARSEAERDAHRALEVRGVTGWVPDHAVRLPGWGLAVLDLAFVEQRVLVEIDGWAYHRDLRAFLHDQARQNALVLAGWTVVRTNWFELRESPETFVRTVRRALDPGDREVVR